MERGGKIRIGKLSFKLLFEFNAILVTVQKQYFSWSLSSQTLTWETLAKESEKEQSKGDLVLKSGAQLSLDI